MVTLTTSATERSTFPIAVTFRDENGDTMTPNAGLTWSLYDTAGNVINSREDVSITPAATVTIVLSGADLALTQSANAWRHLIVEGTFDSDIGSGLPIRDEIRFKIVNLVNP